MVISYFDEYGNLRVNAFNGVKDFWKRAETTPLVNSTAIFVSSGELKIGFPTEEHEAQPVDSFEALKKVIKEIVEVPALAQLDTYLDGTVSFKSEEFFRPLISKRLKGLPVAAMLDEVSKEEFIDYALTQLNPVVYFEENETEEQIDHAVLEAINLATSDLV